MKQKNISLSTIFLVIFVFVIIIMAFFIYKLDKEKNAEISKVKDLNNQVSSLESEVENLQGKINIISSTINPENTDKSSVSYVVLSIEDIEAEEKNQQGLESKTKKITDKEKIDSLMKIINSATEYQEKSFIPDFGDIPPCAIIYLANGEKYTVCAGDQIDDNGETVNLMTKWYSEDGSDKTMYKLNTKLGEYIEKLFNE